MAESEFRFVLRTEEIASQKAAVARRRHHALPLVPALDAGYQRQSRSSAEDVEYHAQEGGSNQENRVLFLSKTTKLNRGKC